MKLLGWYFKSNLLLRILIGLAAGSLAGTPPSRRSPARFWEKTHPAMAGQVINNVLIGGGLLLTTILPMAAS
jgi:hypothetical protein